MPRSSPDEIDVQPPGLLREPIALATSALLPDIPISVLDELLNSTTPTRVRLGRNSNWDTSSDANAFTCGVRPYMLPLLSSTSTKSISISQRPGEGGTHGGIGGGGGSGGAGGGEGGDGGNGGGTGGAGGEGGDGGGDGDAGGDGGSGGG